MKTLLLIIVPTLAYWFWESRAEGNIRIDLLLIYPALFGLYAALLWQRLKFKALVVALLIMAGNVAWFMLSRDLFDKYPG